jgi:hypothetical protein
MPIQCSDCGLANPDGRTTCWSCMQPLPGAFDDFDPSNEPNYHDEDEDEGGPDLAAVTGVAPWYAPFLDAMAGLCWLEKTSTVCVAATLVMVGGKRDTLSVLFTSNVGIPAPALTGERGIADLARMVDKKLSNYEAACHLIATLKEVKDATPGGVSERSNSKCLVSVLLSDKGSVFAGVEQYLHAEMKILDMLFLGIIQPIGDVVYIGISAVCCDNCYRAIGAFNYALDCQERGYRVHVFGHHQMLYSPEEWPLPEFMKAGKNALATEFAEIALKTFFELVPGGNVAFRARPKHLEDESAHMRPKWSKGNGGYNKS